MNRLIPFALILATSVLGAPKVEAQEHCLQVMPQSAALLSDGTLGVAHTGYQPGGSISPFARVRDISPTSCLGVPAVGMMKRACTAFLERYQPTRTLPVQEPTTATAKDDCSAANGTIDLLVKENEKLKRLVRAYKARASTRR